MVKSGIRAGAAALALCWFAVAGAQSPAVDPRNAELAREQQRQQQVQPGNNQPVWSEVRSGIPQYTSIPGRETNVLIEPRGQTWRALRVPVTVAGGWLLAAVVLALIGFYAWRGTIELSGTPTGRKIERFSPAKRITHWTVAITFVILAISGLILTFGKSVLLPLIGYTLFAWLATLAKNLHNFIAPVFSIGLLVMIITFAKDNLPKAHDARWIAKFGGLLDRSGRTHVPSGKFNAGEKAVFWLLVVVLSVTLVISGFILLFPNFDQVRTTMQTANIVHLGAAALAIAIVCFHIYLGTIGMRGAYEGMRYGYVDETWAREHHEYWYNDVMAGRVPGRPAPPVPGGVAHRPA
jgi:formate dehydrogenase subunit gamma